ncbi:DUF885 family protein [Ferrimonas pelagia]|uniref:DUF885 family protein n=1 Tax=Ferrimonas pelagia TaxID=1177826 RepID=UPI0031EBA4A6
MTIGVGGCQTAEPVVTEPVCDQSCRTAQFEHSAAQMLEALLALLPEWALYQGDYRYAARLTVPNERARQQQLDFCAHWREQLQGFADQELTTAGQIDKGLLLNRLDRIEWGLRDYRDWQWNAARYNVAGPFARLLAGDWAEESVKLRTVLIRLAEVPAYYQAARAALTDPTRAHLALAIQQNNGGLTVLGPALLARVADSTLSASEQALFERRYTNCTKSLI